MTDDFLLALPQGHRLTGKARITLDDLKDEPLIFPSKWHAPSTHERLMALFRERGIAPNIVAENPSADILNCLVSAGIGLGFLITSQKDRAPTTVVAREIADFSLPLPLVLAWLKDNRSPIIPNFVAAARGAE
jgi:DNA-binding transcriptional LysR family regulator